MTTLLILVLMLFTIYYISSNSAKETKIFSITTLLVFILVGIGAASSFLLSHLTSYSSLTHPAWAKRNAIILLGAGTVKLPEEENVMPTLLAYSRIYETARLYTNCKKTNTLCKIIITGGDAAATGKSEAEVYQKTLTDIGVNNADIILESKSMNTYKNAEYTSTIINANHFDHAILVTSSIHMKRALLYFKHFGIIAEPAISDYISRKITIIPLGYNFAMTDFAVHEYMGIIRYHLYNYFGLNANPTKAGAL